MASATQDLLVIGKVTAVYGVKGWVKIHSFTEPGQNFVKYQDYYLERADQWEPIEFTELKRHSKGLVGLLDGVTDRDQAKRYCQCNIAVMSDQLAELDDGEYYWHQLEGLDVIVQGDDGSSVLLGKIDHVMETGANDVLVVKACKNSLDDRERLIPYLPEQVVKHIDMDTGVISVEWDPDF